MTHTPNYLVKLLRSVPRDWHSLRPWQKRCTVVFGVLSILLSVIDLHILTDANATGIIKWTSDRTSGIPEWKCVLMTFSGLASFSGVLCVVYAGMGLTSTFFWGAVSCICYGLAALAYDYIGDFQLNFVFFLPMQGVGAYCWLKHGDRGDELARSMSWAARCTCVMVGCGAWALLYVEIPWVATVFGGSYYYTGMHVPHVLDAVAVALQVLAQILMTARFWEQWVLWILADCVQLFMFSGIAGTALDVNLLIMWSLFLVNAGVGLRSWYARSHTVRSDVLIKA